MHKYENLLLQCKDYGELIAPRGIKVRQLPLLELSMPMGYFVTRKTVNLKLLVVEGTNLIRGFTDVEAIRKVAPKTAEKYYDTNQMSYYAERLSSARLISKLTQDSATRKAVEYFGRSSDTPEDTRCMAYIQFQCTKQLNMNVVLRSWDLFLGLPYDIGMCQLYAISLARCLEMEPGYTQFISTNPHLYESHIDKIAEAGPYETRTLQIDGMAKGKPWSYYEDWAQAMLTDPMQYVSQPV